jgi:hypothetical protein
MSSDAEPLDEVGDALGLTAEVLEDAIEDLKAATQEAIRDERFDTVEAYNERLRELRAFAGDVASLLERWGPSGGVNAPRATGPEPAPAGAEELSNRRYFGRVKRGTRTPEAEFRRPLLEVLRDAGGSLPVSDALDRVGERMAGRLNDVDRQPLPSDHRQLRWRNTVQWTRNYLADEGRIDRSVRGVWTITPAGLDWLDRRA